MTSNPQMHDHARYLGTLAANLHSLEFSLRAFLFDDETRLPDASPQRTDFHEFEEGDMVALNAFTNFDSLRDLIRKYNAHPRITSEGLTIDATIADMRDAIAHGRVFGVSPDPPFQLLKFSKPRPNAEHVTVKFSAMMTKQWFTVHIRRVRDAFETVLKAIHAVQSQPAP